jgi:thiol-disulfide isomerase/thioredoxin
MTEPTVFVQIVSAPWCKRCVEIKPRVAELCRIAGAQLEEINYDELDESDSLRDLVKALPTVRMRVSAAAGGRGEWSAYTPKELAIWEDAIKLYGGAAPGDNLDF